jgi:hypothetical protein
VSDLDRFLRPAEAALRLGITEAKLSEWRRADMGPVYYRLHPSRNSLVRYKERDIAAFIQAHHDLMPAPVRPRRSANCIDTRTRAERKVEREALHAEVRKNTGYSG